MGNAWAAGTSNQNVLQVVCFVLCFFVVLVFSLAQSMGYIVGGWADVMSAGIQLTKGLSLGFLLRIVYNTYQQNESPRNPEV